MSKSETNTDNIPEKKDSETSKTDENNNVQLVDDSADKAIAQFRKIREGGDTDLTEKEITELDKECEIIKNRDIITQDTEHIPTEITTKNGEVITDHQH